MKNSLNFNSFGKAPNNGNLQNVLNISGLASQKFINSHNPGNQSSRLKQKMGDADKSV